jgi:DinB superfamily
MPNKTLTIDQVVMLLAETPARLAELTGRLPPAELLSPPSHDEWSANEVLAHVRACADVWSAAMVSILDGATALRAVSPLSWIEKTDYRELDFRRSLREFTAQRTELLAVLKPLPREAWSRTTTVTAAGAPLRRDVLFYGRWMAGHERTHVKQIAGIVKARVS